MNISINIPSFKRAGRVATLKLVPSACLWVLESEADQYREAYPETAIRPFPEALRGRLPAKRNQILDQNQDADVTVLLDDDISQIARWQGNKRIKYTDEGDILAMIERYSILASDWGAFLWGVQLNSDKQSFREYGPFSTLGFISASFSCFLRGNELRYDEALPLKEDYDMLLQQTNRYRLNLRVNGTYIVKEAATNTGGCADIRTLDREREQNEMLQRKWGNAIVDLKSVNVQNHRARNRSFDINPVVRVPIVGV